MSPRRARQAHNPDPGEPQPASFYDLGSDAPGKDGSLEGAYGAGLQEEIAVLRVVMRRMFQRLNTAEDLDAEDLQRSLNSLGLAAIRVGNLLRLQKDLGHDSSSMLSEAINQAISEVAEEMGITERFGGKK